MTDIVIPITLFTLAGGIARMHDGGLLPLLRQIPPNVVYGVVASSLALFLYDANHSIIHNTISVFVPFTAWGSLQMSYRDLWNTWYNLYKFWLAAVGGLGMVYLGYFEWFAVYVLALLFIGALRPAFSKFAPGVKNWTRYVEFIEGAVVFGGLAAVAL